MFGQDFDDDLREPVIQILKNAHRMGMANPAIVELPVHSMRARAFYLGYHDRPMAPVDSSVPENTTDVIVTDDHPQVCKLLRKRADKAGAYAAELIEASTAKDSLGWYLRVAADGLWVGQFKTDHGTWLERFAYDQVVPMAS